MILLFYFSPRSTQNSSLKYSNDEMGCQDDNAEMDRKSDMDNRFEICERGRKHVNGIEKQIKTVM